MSKGHTTHFDDCGCLAARYEARIATLESDMIALRAAEGGFVEAGEILAAENMELRARIATLEAELLDTSQRLGAKATMYKLHCNALRDALENAAVTLRKNDLPHHAQVIVNILAQTPAASLAALKAEVRREALAGLLARIKGTVEWRDEFTNYGKAVRYVTQHIESALAAQAATQHYANVKLTAEFDKACAQEVKP